MDKIRELLKGNFWMIDLSKFNLTKTELEFLRAFFNLAFDQFIDEITFREKNLLILTKKEKFISNPLVN